MLTPTSSRSLSSMRLFFALPVGAGDWLRMESGRRAHPAVARNLYPARRMRDADERRTCTHLTPARMVAAPADWRVMAARHRHCRLHNFMARPSPRPRARRCASPSRPCNISDGWKRPVTACWPSADRHVPAPSWTVGAPSTRCNARPCRTGAGYDGQIDPPIRRRLPPLARDAAPRRTSTPTFLERA